MRKFYQVFSRALGVLSAWLIYSKHSLAYILAYLSPGWRVEHARIYEFIFISICFVSYHIIEQRERRRVLGPREVWLRYLHGLNGSRQVRLQREIRRQH